MAESKDLSAVYSCRAGKSMNLLTSGLAIHAFIGYLVDHRCSILWSRAESMQFTVLKCIQTYRFSETLVELMCLSFIFRNTYLRFCHQFSLYCGKFVAWLSKNLSWFFLLFIPASYLVDVLFSAIFETSYP